MRETELTASFLSDARNFAYGLSKERNLSPGQWPDFLVDGLRDNWGVIIDPQTGEEAHLDVELLFPPDPYDIDGWYDYRDETEYECRTWYRDNLMRPCGPRPRKDNLWRLLTVLTILRAMFPSQARMWGVRPANDN